MAHQTSRFQPDRLRSEARAKVMVDRLMAVCLSGMLTSVVLAGEPNLSGPREGFVFDSPTKSVRPILGMLGAAYLGTAVLNEIDAAWIAPGRQHGIVVQGDKVLLVSGLGSERLDISTLPGSGKRPEGVAWSSDGSLAVLYSATGRWIQKFTHVPDAPVSGQFTDFSVLAGELSAFAVDAPGARIGFGIRGEVDGGVYMAVNDQFPRLLMTIAEPAAVAFGKSESLYVADRATGQIFELQSSGLSASIIRAENGAADFIAIRFGEDSRGRRLFYLVSRADQTLRIYDASTYDLVNEIALEAQPTGMEPVGESSLLLSGRVRSGDPLWLLSGKPSPVVYFVPGIGGGMEGQY